MRSDAGLAGRRLVGLRCGSLLRCHHRCHHRPSPSSTRTCRRSSHSCRRRLRRRPRCSRPTSGEFCLGRRRCRRRICRLERLRPSWRPHTRLPSRWWRGSHPSRTWPARPPARCKTRPGKGSSQRRRLGARCLPCTGATCTPSRAAQSGAAAAATAAGSGPSRRRRQCRRARRTLRTCRRGPFPPRGRSRACNSHGNRHTIPRSRRRRDRHSRRSTRRCRGGCICAPSVCTPSLPFFPPACTGASRCVLNRSRRCCSRACAWTVSSPQPPG